MEEMEETDVERELDEVEVAVEFVAAERGTGVGTGSDLTTGGGSGAESCVANWLTMGLVTSPSPRQTDAESHCCDRGFFALLLHESVV
jgi:hypothetical protein